MEENMKCLKWLGWIGLLCLISGDALAVGMTALDADDMNGCIGVTADGRKMACVGYTGGRAHLEVKDVQNRRMYRVFIFGTDEKPLDPKATSRDEIQYAMRSLDKMGFTPLQQAVKDVVDVFRIPGLTCGLSLATAEERIQVQSSFGKAEWLNKDGLKGKTTLHAVSVSFDHSQLFIVLDHQSPDGEAQIREFKVLRLQDLTGRGDCELEGEKKSQQRQGKKGEPSTPARN